MDDKKCPKRAKIACERKNWTSFTSDVTLGNRATVRRSLSLYPCFCRVESSTVSNGRELSFWDWWYFWMFLPPRYIWLHLM